MKNILLTIAYDGTNFSGWQIQPDKRTVQGVLTEVLSQVCGCRVKLEGASRTDAGVHALGQRATFRGAFGIPVEKLRLVANRLLPGDVKITGLEQVPMAFHARFNACGKKYTYKIRNCGEKDVFQRNYCYTVEKELDLQAMRRGAACFVGTHDFGAFMAMGSTPQQTTVRTIYSYHIGCQELASSSENAQMTKTQEKASPDAGKLISLSVRGDGFLYNMVRIMTGTLLEVGLGRLSPEEIPDIIASKDRRRAGRTVPPWGLYLDRVYFNEIDLKEEEQ